MPSSVPSRRTPVDRVQPVRGTARDAILRAAADIAREGGLAALAVDQVAVRAGVSKGAFFHHFTTRRDMVLALIDQLVQAFEADLRARLTRRVKLVDALIATTFAEVERDPGLIVTLVTAVVLDRSLGPIVERQLREFRERMLADGTTPETATLVRAALDGLLQHLIIRAGKAPDPEYVRELRAALKQLTRRKPANKRAAAS